MTQRLANKVALIVGASSGIGAATAQRFAAEGAQVIAAGLPIPAPFDSPMISVHECDVTMDVQVCALVELIIKHHGRMDILVNAAGIMISDDAATITDELWLKQNDVNLGGTMRTQRAVLPHMVRQRSGAIVNIASVAAFNASATQATYSVSKAGMVALSRSTAQTYGQHGIRVNALCPGWVDTPMSQREMREMAAEQNITPEQAANHTVKRIALSRMAQPDEIAAACLFLASDEASFITGIALVADGGMRIPAASRGF